MTAAAAPRYLTWLAIVRLGLVQSAIGAVVVLTTSTLNRVMVVELALAAVVPGALVGWHYAVQMSRPRWGHGSDQTGRRTPWIRGGMGVLALGGILAADATALASVSTVGGLVLAAIAFTLIGIGVGAAGTSLLAFLATATAPGRRAAAGSLAFIMMIVGLAATAGIVSGFLDPFSYQRLVVVASVVCLVAFLIAHLATWGVEATVPPPGWRPHGALDGAPDGAPDGAMTAREAEPTKTPFREAFAQVWAEPPARRFTVFVFVSMLAYNMQDLILEPFAGLVFGYTPGESTGLAGLQHGGALVGMIPVAVLSGVFGKRVGARQTWTILGCFASAGAVALLAAASVAGPGWPLRVTVFFLGAATGAFAVAAFGAMVALAGHGDGRHGVRMGVWGAAQAAAFGLGGFIGSAALDVARAVFSDPVPAFASVFAAEAALFIVAGVLAARVWAGVPASAATPAPGREPSLGVGV